VTCMGGAEETIGISVGSRLACELLSLQRVSAGAHSHTQTADLPRSKAEGSSPRRGTFRWRL
jgi:hypothetical protein